MNSINNKGELGSPCFRPLNEVKKRDLFAWNLTHDLTIEYVERRALTNLLLTFSDNNFCHKKDLLTLSKAFHNL